MRRVSVVEKKKKETKIARTYSSKHETQESKPSHSRWTEWVGWRWRGGQPDFTYHDQGNRRKELSLRQTPLCASERGQKKQKKKKKSLFHLRMVRQVLDCMSTLVGTTKMYLLCHYWRIRDFRTATYWVVRRRSCLAPP